MARTAAGPPEPGTLCFHCALPVPAGLDLTVSIDGEPRPMCCPGCQAVAQAIVGAGLADYYRHRTSPAGQGETAIPEALAAYDRPEVQRGFARDTPDGAREASLILEGLTCAACAWLNERHLGGLEGVLAFNVNYATHRARVRWDPSRIELSRILAAAAEIGYRAHPFDPGRQQAVQRRESALALRRLGIAAGCGMQVMMLSVAMYAGDYYGMDAALKTFMRWISLFLAVPVVLYSAGPFFTAAWRDLDRRRLGMDVPIALAIGAGFLASAWNTWHGSGETYFDSVCMFTFLLLGARFLEMRARHRAVEASEALARCLPATVTRLGPEGETPVAAAELRAGDRVLVRPGETIPADGRLEEGSTCTDEALLTGEGLPRPKRAGDTLIGGSVNLEHPATMVVTQVGPDTMLSSIARLLDRAQGEKPRIALAADRIASWFVGLVLILAGLTAWWWWHAAPEEAFRVVLSVLVVTCPCALSLATPAAVTAATTRLAGLGLLVTRGHALETLAGATDVVLDKTGTLTHGDLRLNHVEPLGALPAARCQALAAALERGSEHPIGRALATAGAPPAAELRARPGEGVEGRIDGVRYRAGSLAFCTGIGPPSDTGSQEAGGVYLASAQHGLLARFDLADTLPLRNPPPPGGTRQARDSLRADATEVVEALQAMGLRVHLLSGDRPEAVAAVARRCGIQRFEGALLPAAKLARVRALQQAGRVVAMVGDGINDAPVLAGAQVSVAMGRGTEMAHAAADAILLGERLTGLITGIRMARRTLRVIRQNLAWAAGYNLLAVPLAASGWVAPWMAALGMSLSSALVIANAARLRRARGEGHANRDYTHGRRAARSAA